MTQEPATPEAAAPKSPGAKDVATDDATADKASESGAESIEEGESRSEPGDAAPALPKEAVPEGPPLPAEPVPPPQDDGWDCQWDPNTQSWFFYNRFTGKSQWDNPRVPQASAAAPAEGPLPPADEKPAAGGYNPAIHGDYDPNAWYAQGNKAEEQGDDLEAPDPSLAVADPYAAGVGFNRFTGQFQTEDAGPARHGDEAKSKRQMNAYFDVDAAANSHDGRSLKAERSNKKPSKSELKAFKEKRRARKEEKRRAWLRD